MNPTNPQMVRSLLRLIPTTLKKTPTAGIGGPNCSQCRSRAFSAWSGAASKRTRSPVITNHQWPRPWSCSAVRMSSNDRDKPSPNLFHMPPPGSHFDENAAGTGKDAVIQPPPSHVERVPSSSTTPSIEEADSLARSPPAGQTEKATQFESQLPPNEPVRQEEPTERVQAEEHSGFTDPIHTPAPKAKVSPSEDVASSSTSTSSNTSLPSDTERERWQLSKNTQKWMDDFLAKAAIFSQRLNTYTGTDYSGIEALRREIIEQERDVKRRHASIAAAKEAYTQAHAAQTASQKEVVGLLERKHSWSAGDLERYMSLIRSEHLNEQAVQRAKDELTSEERSLEDARSTLERKERKQYHEEQIWSDTIRRNSTWVTFGLMGLNIFLLLANLAIIEPWRRRRLVKEVRSALEKNALATSASITAATASTGPAAAVQQAIESEIDEIVEPVKVNIEEAEETVAQTVPEAVREADDGEAAGKTVLAAGEVLPEEALEVLPVDVPEAVSEAVPEVVTRAAPHTLQEKVEERWEHWKTVFQDMFSDRQVTLKQVDLTTVALESAAAGIAVMGLLVLLFNPR